MDKFKPQNGDITPEQTLKVRIPPNPRFGRSVRQAVLSFAGKFEIGHDELEEFIFALGEALANAIEHSHSAEVIEVRCQVEDGKILATVTDAGAGFQDAQVSNVSLPSEYSERGRGLPIMRRCTDIFAVHSMPGRGTSVVLGRYLRHRRGMRKTS